jgi:hypothetical protein
VDGWLASVSANGKTRWIQQIGTAQTDLITDIVSLDRNTYALIGWTKGALYSASFGGSDAFVTKVNQNGMIVSGLQFGAAENEAGGSGVLLDSNQLIIGGVTSSNLFSLNFGQADVYLKSIFL